MNNRIVPLRYFDIKTITFPLFDSILPLSSPAREIISEFPIIIVKLYVVVSKPL
jgi:hypothetical protein